MRVAAWLRSHKIAHLFVFQIASMLAFDYWSRIEVPHHQERHELHDQIVARTAPYQFRYRVAIPALAEAVSRAFPYSPAARFQLAYVVLNWVALVLFFGCLYHLVREWSGPVAGLFGMTLAAVLTEFTFRNHYFQPWSFWEAAQFAGGLLMIRHRAYWPLLLICVAGAANRETSVFLPLMFLLAALPHVRSRAFRFASAALVLWAAAYLGVHLAVGYRPATLTFGSIVQLNLQHAGFAVLLNLLLFGPVWPLVVSSFAGAPVLLRRGSAVVILYLLAVLIAGAWWELRYWLTALPVLIPALVLSVARKMAPAKSETAVPVP